MIKLVQACITAADKEYLRHRLEQGLLEDEAEVDAFEDELAHRTGGCGAVATNSGTSALCLALLAAGVEPGDEVILPSYTCIALLHAVRHCRAVPVLVDNACDARRANFHALPEAIRNRRTPKTAAVLISQMFGTLLPLDPLYRLGVPVIEDFTLSFGAERELGAGPGRGLGVCSFHWSKMISTGQGGAVICHDEQTLCRVRQLCHYDAPMESWRYATEDELRGSYAEAYNYRMSPLQAALGRSQLRQLAGFVARRRAIAKHYTGELEAAGIPCPEVPPDASNVFFRYMIEAEQPAEQILRALLLRDIEAGRGVFPALHLLLDLDRGRFAGATRAMRHLISVPVHPALSDAEVERVAAEVVEVLTSKSG